MNKVTRRQFAKAVGLGAAVASVPFKVMGQAKPKVVIVGGGAGGATAARYVAMNSSGAVDVTLIENSNTYTTCFFSNLYLGGFRDFNSITHSYETLASEYDIKVIQGYATDVNRNDKTVKLDNGDSVNYDRLVLSPGIDFLHDSVPGYSEEAAEIAPHAWQAGPQTQLLKEKLDAAHRGPTSEYR